MPDNSDPTAINPTPVTTPAGETNPQSPTVTPEQTPPPSFDSDVPPPPPQPAGGAGPVGDMQGLGIPPVITPQRPKGKLSGRMVATILGILVLIGGLGAGVILVRQQQLFSQKAAGTSGSCNATPECDTAHGCYCSASHVCVCPTPTPTPIGGSCNATPECDTAHGCYCSASHVCVCPTPTPTPAPQPCKHCVGTSCELTRIIGCSSSANTCNSNSDCGSGISCIPDHETQKCNDSGQMCTYYVGEMGWREQGCTTHKSDADHGVQYCNDNCQDPAGCNNHYYCIATNDIGSCISNQTCDYRPPDNCHPDPSCAGGGTPTPPPPPSAQCLGIKAYDTNWNPLTATQLSSLKANDVVRFTVSGTASSGTFDRAKFKINGVDSPEVTQKKPGTEEFYYEYTIPTGVTSFTIKAQIHHTSLGWF